VAKKPGERRERWRKIEVGIGQMLKLIETIMDSMPIHINANQSRELNPSTRSGSARLDQGSQTEQAKNDRLRLQFMIGCIAKLEEFVFAGPSLDNDKWLRESAICHNAP
jgi:hypothetical protein